MNSLVRAHAYNVINSFIDRVITGYKQYPDIFLWVAKNLFGGSWSYEWLDYSRERLAVTLFRLMNELKKIEIEGNRLKNLAIDALFDNQSAMLKTIVEGFDRGFLGKIYDLFLHIPYVEEGHKEAFLSLIRSRFSDFQPITAHAEEGWEPDEEKLIVSEEGHRKMKAELDRLVNVELGRISRELNKVAEVSADIRENVEYNALMEKQATLELTILKLDSEMKRARILNRDEISTDAVNVGTRVVLQDVATGDERDYTILGPWDADFEKRILSYRSPIASSLLKKRPGEIVKIDIGEGTREYRVAQIEKYRV